MTQRPTQRGPGAVVIGGDYRSLGVVRSLGRRGIPVWVLRDDHYLAHWSRYCERALPWPDTTEREKVAYLVDLAHKHGLEGWVLFPTEDETAALIARNRAELAACWRLSILADWDTLRRAYDKRLTYQLADDAGVAHPRTSYPANAEDVDRYTGPYPVILKPAIGAPRSALAVAKAWPAKDAATLIAKYHEACASIDPSLIMLQEPIPGGGRQQLSYAALCDDGRPLASLVARRMRQWPMDFGRASTYVETVDAADVEESAERVLAKLRFSGLVEVEFKRDARDGTLKLLDINPRVWGWHTLGRPAGVDFPYLLWQLMSGVPVTRRRGTAGIRWVRGLTDLPTSLREMRAGRLSPRAYISSLTGRTEFAVLAPDDPLPALLEVPGTLYLGWKRRRAAAAAPSSIVPHLVGSGPAPSAPDPT
jgi:predicted ATP-grasp superfamily ATP-dependent carboligase